MLSNSVLKSMQAALSEFSTILPPPDGSVARDQALQEFEEAFFKLEAMLDLPAASRSEAETRAAVIRVRNAVQTLALTLGGIAEPAERVTSVLEKIDGRSRDGRRPRGSSPADPFEYAPPPLIEVTPGRDGQDMVIVLTYTVSIRPSPRESELFALLQKEPERWKPASELHAAMQGDDSPVSNMKYFVCRARKRGIPIETSQNIRGETQYRLRGRVVIKSDQA